MPLERDPPSRRIVNSGGADCMENQSVVHDQPARRVVDALRLVACRIVAERYAIQRILLAQIPDGHGGAAARRFDQQGE